MRNWEILFWFTIWFKAFPVVKHLLRVVLYKVIKTFNMSYATQAVAFHISKTLERVGHTRTPLLNSSHNFWSTFLLLFFNRIKRLLPLVLDGNFSQEYPIGACVTQGFILIPALFLLYIKDRPDDVICNITIHVKCDCTQTDLNSEFKSALAETVDWVNKKICFI